MTVYYVFKVKVDKIDRPLVQNGQWVCCKCVLMLSFHSQLAFYSLTLLPFCSDFSSRMICKVLRTVVFILSTFKRATMVMMVLPLKQETPRTKFQLRHLEPGTYISTMEGLCFLALLLCFAYPTSLKNSGTSAQGCTIHSEWSSSISIIS